MERAFAQYDAADQIDITWKSFQLDPDMDKDSSISTLEYLVDRKGYPKEQVAMMSAQLAEQGKDYGIDFQFDKARSFNTFDAHRLLHWAKQAGKSNALKETLMVDHFTKGIDLSVKEQLMKAASAVGLDSAKASEVLDSDQFGEQVRHDIYQSRQLGVSGVPFFLINEKTAIGGAQPDQVFENAVAAALKDLSTSLNISDAKVCTPDQGCT